MQEKARPSAVLRSKGGEGGRKLSSRKQDALFGKVPAKIGARGVLLPGEKRKLSLVV